MEPGKRAAFRSGLRRDAYRAECEAEMRLHDFSDSSMAFLGCDLDGGKAHADLSHHDPVLGIWWSPCRNPEHGHPEPDNEGMMTR